MCDQEHIRLMKDHAAEMHALDDALHDTVWGPFDPTLGDKVRDHEKGIQHQIGVLYAHSANGGIPSRLTANDRRLIFGSFTTLLGVLVADILLHI